jgi:hypothetical protein
MYLQGVLIEAKDLVNDVSIVQASQVENVTYIHVELQSHDVILAEGAPSESFVDDDSRGMFLNAYEYYQTYENELRRPALYYAPRLSAGYPVEAARRQIAVRAGLRQINSDPVPLKGFVDLISTRVVSGWAQNAQLPEAPVCVEILADGHVIGTALANIYREDLKIACLGSGHHSFEFSIPGDVKVALDSIEVRRALDGRAIPKGNSVTPPRRRRANSKF